MTAALASSALAALLGTAEVDVSAAPGWTAVIFAVGIAVLRGFALRLIRGSDPLR